MIESLLLDGLLILVIVLLIPVGMYRGGVREICSAAGLLLGILVSQQWSVRWGDWLADLSGIDTGVSRFVVAVVTIVLGGAVVGYGAGASFDYHPGPSGRVYGGVIALLSGVIVLGALVQFVATYLYNGIYPEVVTGGYVSRALSEGFDWVLLTVTFVGVLVILFGMIVRERDASDIAPAGTQPPFEFRRPTPVQATAIEPEVTEPKSDPDPSATTRETAPLKIHEVRHWEEPSPPTERDIRQGWSRTWPSDVVKPPAASPTPAKPRLSQPNQGHRREEQVISDWLADEGGGRRSRPDTRRPPRDE